MRLPVLPALGLATLASSCAFHSTATHRNQRVGPGGEPVWVKSTRNVGLNLFVVLKVAGGTDIDGMIHELTASIAAEGGGRVRITQSSTENYRYGFPPETWISTPVITTVATDYEPMAQALASETSKQAGE